MEFLAVTLSWRQEYYCNLPSDTYAALGTKSHSQSLRRFDIIRQGENNDFDRAINLTKFELQGCVVPFTIVGM